MGGLTRRLVHRGLLCWGFWGLPVAWGQTVAAPNAPTHEFASWTALMTEGRLRGPWSFWFDVHYNTRAFFVVRPGLTYRFASGLALTGGYAYVLTDPGSGGFTRDEHRPWVQGFLPFQLGGRFSASQRLRLELRIRERVEGGEVVSGWSEIMRLRSQTTLTYAAFDTSAGQIFLQTAIELLVNGGAEAGPNFLDQNRFSLMPGLRHDPVTLRIGYVLRFLPGSSGVSPVYEHDAVVWLSYRYEPKRAPSHAHAPELGNP